MQVEIFNQFFVRNVAETNVIDVDFTSDISDGVLGISTFRFFFQKSKDSGRACKCILKLCNDRTDIIEELKECSQKAVFYSSLTNPSTRFVNNVIYAGVALAGAFMIPGGSLTVGGLSG